MTSKQQRETRIPIEALSQKIDHLKECGNFSSTDDLLAAIIEKFPAYNSKLKRREFDRMVGDSKMNGTYQEALGLYFKFDPASRIWTDGNCQEEDGTKTFELFLDPPRDASVLLDKAAPVPPIPSVPEGLALIELQPGQYGFDSSLLGFDISCGSVLIEGQRFALPRCFIKLDCGRAQITRDSRRGRGEAYEVTGEQGQSVIFRWSGGSTMRPRWESYVQGGVMGDVDVPPDFVMIEGLAPGDRVIVSLSMCKKDFEPDTGDIDRTDDIAVVDAEGVPLPGELEELTIVKLRALACIAGKEQQCQQDGDDGFITLSTHEVGFIKKEPSP